MGMGLAWLQSPSQHLRPDSFQIAIAAPRGVQSKLQPSMEAFGYGDRYIPLLLGEEGCKGPLVLDLLRIECGGNRPQQRVVRRQTRLRQVHPDIERLCFQPRVLYRISRSPRK